MGGSSYRGGKYGGGDTRTKKYRVVGIDANGDKTLLTIIAKNEKGALAQAKNNGYPNTLGKWIAPEDKATTSMLNETNVGTLSDKRLDSIFKSGEEKKKRKKQ